MMFSKRITIAAILLAMVSVTLSVHLCLTWYQYECHPCHPKQQNICDNITNDIKVLIFHKNTTVYYKLHLNTSIRMIIEDDKITFYPCSIWATYFQVDRKNYYPIGRNVYFPSVKLIVNSLKHIKFKFQDCLTTFCSFSHNNRFGCYHMSLRYFNFTFDQIVTSQCVQNITFASIYSETIFEITQNTFFLTATNLIYLKLAIPNLNYFQCHIFEKLSNLKIIQFEYYSTHLINYNKCIFFYSPNIIKIDIGYKTLWNTCNRRLYTDTHTTKLIPKVSCALKITFKVITYYLISFLTYFLI